MKNKGEVMKIIFILTFIMCRQMRRAKNVNLKILVLKLRFRIREKLETRTMLSLQYDAGNQNGIGHYDL
jgi:hypothetical protein